MAVELGSVTLEHLTEVDVVERARVVEQAVPALAGDLVQLLGRSSVRVRLGGSFFGPDADDQLAALRVAQRGEQPLDLLADAVGEGYVARVLVVALDVAERAGSIDRYDYRLELVEYVEPPAPAGALLGGLDPGIDTSLAAEAAGYVDGVQNALSQVSQLAGLLGIAGFGDPTTKAPKLLTAYQDAGGDRTDPADRVRDAL